MTGTRFGMSLYQRKCFSLLDKKLWTEFHHGDCVGADVETASMCHKLGIKTVCHPPVDETLRAKHDSSLILPAKTHFERNRNIVNSVDLLIVIPKDMERQPRGGTWYTHDYSVKRKVQLLILWPQEKEETNGNKNQNTRKLSE